jgi:hypothetical protein
MTNSIPHGQIGTYEAQVLVGRRLVLVLHDVLIATAITGRLLAAASLRALF